MALVTTDKFCIFYLNSSKLALFLIRLSANAFHSPNCLSLSVNVALISPSLTLNSTTSYLSVRYLSFNSTLSLLYISLWSQFFSSYNSMICRLFSKIYFSLSTTNLSLSEIINSWSLRKIYVSLKLLSLYSFNSVIYLFLSINISLKI